VCAQELFDLVLKAAKRAMELQPASLGYRVNYVAALSLQQRYGENTSTAIAVLFHLLLRVRVERSLFLCFSALISLKGVAWKRAVLCLPVSLINLSPRSRQCTRWRAGIIPAHQGFKHDDPQGL
jgi:hypothetical protein